MPAAGQRGAGLAGGAGAHGKPTAARSAGETRVLCIQDTTELDFTSKPGIAGLGRLTHDRQHGMYARPGLPCGVAFPAEEWLAARRKPPPDAPPPLGVMVRIVAGFGGFLGRKGDGHPGPKALWEGLLKLMAYVEAFQVAHEAYGEG